MYSLIALKFGANKEHIKLNSGTEFGMNFISMNPHLLRFSNQRYTCWSTQLTHMGHAWKIGY